MNKKNPKEKSNIEQFKDMITRIYHEVAKNMHSIDEKTIENALKSAKETAIRLEEMSIEEAEVIAKGVKKELYTLLAIMKDTGKSIAEALKIELNLPDDSLIKLVGLLADQTSLENFEIKTHKDNIYKTGEIVVSGEFKCIKCKHITKLTQTQEIPKCSKCKEQRFARR